MTPFRIALYAACRVAVSPAWELRSFSQGDGTCGIQAQRWDIERRRPGTPDGRAYYVLVETLGLESEVERPGHESSRAKVIRRAVDALLQELDEAPDHPGMCKACGAGLRSDGLCPMCESKIAAGL